VLLQVTDEVQNVVARQAGLSGVVEETLGQALPDLGDQVTYLSETQSHQMNFTNPSETTQQIRNWCIKKKLVLSETIDLGIFKAIAIAAILVIKSKNTEKTSKKNANKREWGRSGFIESSVFIAKELVSVVYFVQNISKEIDLGFFCTNRMRGVTMPICNFILDQLYENL